jgi:5-methylthioadenosine/S-adenosylhomocysteine deaminase
MDTLVTNTLLLTMDPEVPGATGDLGIVDNGAIGWADGELTYVGPMADVETADADRVVDGDGCLTLPGFVNAHVHGRQSLLRGAAQDVPEIEWMTRVLGPISGHMTAEDGVVGAKITAIEALLSGTTTLGEYAGEVAELVDKVYKPLGLRVAATETIHAVPDDRSDIAPDETYPFNRDAANEAITRTENLFDRFDDDRFVRPAYGPQALDMIPLDLLESITEQARTHDRTVHMHVAQGERERRQIAARYGDGATTVGVLDDEGLLGTHLLAAHLHGATPHERERLADAGVRMVGCPSSITAIDGTVPPIVEYHEHGGTVGLGTDQAPGPGGHNALREARTAAMLVKADRSDPTALDAAGAIELATIGGARALGIADSTGSLSPGKRADVVICDMEQASVAPMVETPFHTAIPNLVYGTSGNEIRDVFIDGVQRVSDGSIVGLNVNDVVNDANKRAKRVFEDAEADWRAAESSLVTAVDNGRL